MIQIYNPDLDSANPVWMCSENPDSPYVEGVPARRCLIELTWDNANNHTEEAVIMELKD